MYCMSWWTVILYANVCIDRYISSWIVTWENSPIDPRWNSRFTPPFVFYDIFFVIHSRSRVFASFISFFFRCSGHERGRHQKSEREREMPVPEQLFWRGRRLNYVRKAGALGCVKSAAKWWWVLRLFKRATTDTVPLFFFFSFLASERGPIPLFSCIFVI